MFGRLLWPLILSPFTSHRMRRFLSNPKRADLQWLAARAAEGSLRPVVGSRFALGETPAALRLIESGHSRGKVVIAIQAAPAFANQVGGTTITSPAVRAVSARPAAYGTTVAR
jgi:hypothetical protein